MATKSSHFDLAFSKQYQSLHKQLLDTYNQIEQANKEKPDFTPQKKELLAKIKDYKAAIIKLVSENTDKVFEEYAKKLFDMSLYVIGKNLSGSAIRFDKLSADEKLSFAQAFINHIASRFHVNPTKISYEENMPENMYAAYDFDKTIKINKNNINQKIVDLQFFIGAILHEFTHYLYVKHPSKTPVGEQKVAAVMENFIPDSPNGISSQADLDAYKQRPFEAPAYYVQDYFEKHKFYEQLMSLLTPKPEYER